jgi:hypothetical protein
MVFCAFFFAIHDYGKVNVLLSFIVGFFTGGVFLALSFGPIFLFLFLGTFFAFLSGQRNPTKRVEVIAAIMALIVIVAAWVAVFGVASRIPVMGRQVTFMFRDW